MQRTAAEEEFHPGTCCLQSKKAKLRRRAAKKTGKSFRKWHFLIDIAGRAAYHYDCGEDFAVCGARNISMNSPNEPEPGPCTVPRYAGTGRILRSKRPECRGFVRMEEFIGG